MTSPVRLALLSTILLLTFKLFAQDTDADGGKDSALITRLPGSTVHFETGKLAILAHSEHILGGDRKDASAESGCEIVR
jgi:hypothetical protein